MRSFGTEINFFNGVADTCHRGKEEAAPACASILGVVTLGTENIPRWVKFGRTKRNSAQSFLNFVSFF